MWLSNYLAGGALLEKGKVIRVSITMILRFCNMPKKSRNGATDQMLTAMALDVTILHVLLKVPETEDVTLQIEQKGDNGQAL